MNPFDVSLSSGVTGFDISLSATADLRTKLKVGGTFTAYQWKIKIGGTFVVKPVGVKVGGTFVT
jgi:hypothetical protein